MSTPKSISRFACAILASAVVALPSSASIGGTTITLDKDLYEVGDTATATITGTPGDVAYLVIDTAVGPTTLPGVGTFDIEAGATMMIFPLGVIPPSGSVTISHTAICDGFITSDKPIFMQGATFDPLAGLPLDISNLEVVEWARGDDCGVCPEAAVGDPLLAKFPGGIAVWLPGIGIDFVFSGTPLYVEYGDGTARLTGEIYSASAPTKSFEMDILIEGRVGFGDVGYPPMGSPKTELKDKAYKMNGGGPVDTLTWHYYESVTGLLVGTGDFAGGNIGVTRFGPAWQVGYGADNLSVEHGASGWLTLNVLSTPPGESWVPIGNSDINITTRSCVPSEPLCVIPPGFDPQYSTFPGGVAVWIPGIGTDYVSSPDMKYTEYPDGSARLIGETFSAANPLDRFLIDVFYTNRVDPGDPVYPPPLSPKLELKPSAYIQNGGPIDPSTWQIGRAHV